MNKSYIETESTPIYQFFAKMFGWKYEIKSKLYRKHIHGYFYWKEWIYETSITSVRSFKHEGKTIIQIETHRPGVLIGKGGEFIDGLKQYLIEETGEEIVIELIECKMWHNLYSI